MLDRKINMTASIDVSTYVHLKERARREQRSLSSVVREMIQRGLDHERDDEAQQQEIER